jgi:hypothetical protein
MLAARDNPFAVHRVLRVRYRLAEHQWDELLSRLATLNNRAAITGPHGSGKTTLLEDLAPRLAARGFRPKLLRLDAENPAFDPAFLTDFFARLEPGDFILFDGAEQSGFWAWRKFLRASRRAAGMAITVHKPGRLPTLHECRTTPGLLTELVRELGEKLSLQDAASLFARHNGNLRDCLRELYDAAAES